MKFNTTYDRIRSKPEPGGGENLVEVAGYITAEKRINNLLLAGMQLQKIRQEQYDFAEDAVDEDAYDPTRSGNYDLADASRDLAQSQARLRMSLKARQTAQDALQSSKNSVNDTKDGQV